MHKIAIVNPELGFAGPDTVAVWIMQSLKDQYEVSLITTDDPDFYKLNQFFNCTLDETIKVIKIPLPKFLKNTPRARLLKQHLLMRYCKKNKNKFDVFISAYGEMDFGKRGVQYIHFPEIVTEAKMVSTNKFYRDSLPRRIYQRVAWFFSHYTLSNVKHNVTLVNSDWTKEVVDNLYGIDSIVMYPPVLDDFKKVDWEDKKNGFVYIGRMSQDKRPLELIQIIKKVSSLGHDVCIYLLGNVGMDKEYVRKIEEEARQHPAVVFYEGKVSRERLIELVSNNRYGISGKKFEHFGIAVAEMVKAGNIVFINNDGGQVDTVGKDKDLIYDSDADAVDKIVSILRDEDMQRRKLAELKILAKKFSLENFMQQTKSIVEQILRD